MKRFFSIILATTFIVSILYVTYTVNLKANRGFTQFLPGKINNKADINFSMPVGVALDSKDNIYVVDTDYTCVMKFTPNGKFVSKWGVKGKNDGQLLEPWDIKIDKDGFVYISDLGTHCIQKFTVDGVFVKKYAGDFMDPYSIFIDNVGAIYVTDWKKKYIKKLTNDGQLVLQFEITEGLKDEVYDVTVDTAGNIYVTHGNDSISKYSKNGTLIQKIKANANKRESISIRGIDTDAEGNIYVTDGQNNCVQKYSNKGRFIWESAKNTAVEGQMKAPRKVQLDSKNNLVVCSTFNHCIIKFTNDCRFISSIGGASNASGRFNHPSGITIDQQKNIYVADTANNRIQKFDAKGQFIMEWGNKGSERLKSPKDIAIDKANHLYVIDDYSVWVYSSVGKLIKKWNVGSAGGIGVDNKGNVYITLPRDELIKKYTSEGKLLLQWGHRGNDSKSLNCPEAIAIDNKGYIYVVNCWNSYIQKFDENGKLIFSLNKDKAIDYDLVYSIAVDKQNNIYLGSKGFISKVDPTGKLIRKYGQLGFDDGQFQLVNDLAFDKDGNLFAVDSSNNRIQKLTHSENTLLNKF